MKISDLPAKFPIPFAASAGSGFIRAIPQASQIGITGGAASLTDGFPPLTFQPVGAGGIPPWGQDFNGLLNQITLWSQWQNAGGLVTYDSAFQTAISGYPRGAMICGNNPGVVFLSLVDNNVTNPNTGGAGWANFIIGVPGGTILYVRSDGNNSNNGSANTAGSALQTINGALAYAAANFFQTVTIIIGLAGTYAAPTSITIPNITIQGDITNQANFIISGAGPAGGATGVIAVASGCSLLFRGATLNNLGSINHNFASSGTGSIYVEYCTILTAVSTTFALAFSGGSSSITLGVGNIWQASAGYMWLADGGSISMALSQTLASTPSFTVATAAALDGGKILRFAGANFLGTGAFGTRYSASLNGVINMLGGGANFIPGNSAGITATGGQYG